MGDRQIQPPEWMMMQGRWTSDDVPLREQFTKLHTTNIFNHIIWRNVCFCRDGNEFLIDFPWQCVSQKNAVDH
jgi:hypothetical protein